MVTFKLLVAFTLRGAANSCFLSKMQTALLWSRVAGVPALGTCLLPPLNEVSTEVLLAHATYHGTAGNERQPPTVGMGLGASHGRGEAARAEGGVGAPPLRLGEGVGCRS